MLYLVSPRPGSRCGSKECTRATLTTRVYLIVPTLHGMRLAIQFPLPREEISPCANIKTMKYFIRAFLRLWSLL